MSEHEELERDEPVWRCVSCGDAEVAEPESMLCAACFKASIDELVVVLRSVITALLAPTYDEAVGIFTHDYKR